MAEEKPKRASAKSANRIETDAPEVVVQMPLSDLHDFPNHPFKVRDDEAIELLVHIILRISKEVTEQC